MAIIRVETFIRAAPEVCFDLARSVEAHIKSAADTGERVVGGKTTGLLELGDEIIFEARHLGIRQRLTAKITEFERPGHFTDVMQAGAFARLRHEHRFEATDGGTVMTDILDFASPFGPFGRSG